MWRKVCIALLGSIVAVPLIAEKLVSIPEEIEWTWEVRPPHPDPQLPNVLLLGDSISRNYFPEVRKDLAGVANVYLMATSTCVGGSAHGAPDCRVRDHGGSSFQCRAFQQRHARLGIH
jgi:hypothetical protein